MCIFIPEILQAGSVKGLIHHSLWALRVCYRRIATVSSHSLVPYISVLHQFLNNLLKRLSVPKTSVLDPIPTKLLYKTLEVLLPTITNILNESLTWGIVPSEFKTAVVKPLLKKLSLDPNVLKNYRSISNLPFLSKRLEKLVLQQLVSHLSTHNLLGIHQPAYRSGHSTETVLLRILNDPLTSLDDNKISILLLLDLSAVFDTTSNTTLAFVVQPWTGFDLTFLTGNIADQKSTETSFIWCSSRLCTVHFVSNTTYMPYQKTLFVTKFSQMTHSSITLNRLKIAQTLSVHFKIVSVEDIGLLVEENKLKPNNDKTSYSFFIITFCQHDLATPTGNFSEKYWLWVCGNRQQPRLHLR